MTVYRFKAQALTPVHVGSGNEIDPLEFILHGNRLIHFNPSDVVNRLPAEELRRYLELLERADLKAIQSFLRNHLDPKQQNDVVSIDASEAFRNEFERKASTPDNRFRVFMMPRNLHSAQVYLPGSSLKGAIRTALLNHFANLDDETRQSVHARVSGANEAERGRALEESAFGRRQSETERDVLRLLDVEDVALPDASTRIDRAVNINPSSRGSEKIQMWVERLKSLADSYNAPGFQVSLHLDQSAMQHRRVKAQLGRTLDFDTILSACNRFYWGRMKAEGDKFDDKASCGQSWKAIHDLFPRGKTPEPDAPIFTIDPGSPYWRQPARKRMLLRVGRFSHFESLSVDELRQGYNIQARRPIKDMGASRTRCLMENQKPPMPFGWLMLTLESIG